LRREENRRIRRKTLGARTRTNNKLNPHMTPGPGMEPGPYWWEASTLITVPSLLPNHAQKEKRCPKQVNLNLPRSITKD